MFEIMADNPSVLIQFYSSVFGWQVEMQNGFGLIQFPCVARPLFGGIGQAEPGKVGWERGITFYFEVPSVTDDLLSCIHANGGEVVVPRTEMGGFIFAMFRDPEQNLLGIMQVVTKCD
jgi:predicted enzyme related to lactoylglutathione lyase